MSTVEKRVKSRWDYAAYAAIPPDGKRHEIIDGDHFVNPVPNLYHQEVSRHIQFQLYTQIELADLGKVINAPVDLQLSDHDIVQVLQLVLQGDRYTESVETTAITMKVAPQATVDLTRVW